MKLLAKIWGETGEEIAAQLRALAGRVEKGESTARGAVGKAGYDCSPFAAPPRERAPAAPVFFAGWNQADDGTWHHFDNLNLSTCEKTHRVGGAIIRRDVREKGTCPDCRRALEIPRFRTDLQEG